MVSKKFEQEQIKPSLYRISPKIEKKHKINTKLYKLWRRAEEKIRNKEKEIENLKFYWEEKLKTSQRDNRKIKYQYLERIKKLEKEVYDLEKEVDKKPYYKKLYDVSYRQFVKVRELLSEETDKRLEIENKYRELKKEYHDTNTRLRVAFSIIFSLVLIDLILFLN
jgi:chromosome segregation ATPase